MLTQLMLDLSTFMDVILDLSTCMMSGATVINLRSLVLVSYNLGMVPLLIDTINSITSYPCGVIRHTIKYKINS